MKKYTISELQQQRESEDRVEFKKGENGNVSYNGAKADKPQKRRRCILGYVTALCNEGGGRIVIGMEDKHPHKVVGTSQAEMASDNSRVISTMTLAYAHKSMNSLKTPLISEC